ncbi:MAG: hypothetical protein RLZZ303_2060 [Candidatus Hydrogenedentota bacterium]|jgi:hypothetical protein
MSCHRKKWIFSALLLLVAGLLCLPAAATGTPDCGEGTLLSHPPDLSEFSNNAFVSVRAANAQVYQRFGAVSGTVTGLRWWGITASSPANTNCTIDTPSFKVGFYEDNLSVPGGGIQEFTVTPTITDSGSTLFGFPLRLFEVTLPNSLEIEGPGWLTVFDPSFSQSCRFFWAASETGGGQAVSFNFSELSWEALNDDVAFCIVGEPSGEEEGEPEPSLNCYEESLFGQAPDLGPFGTGHFSTRASNRKVHERFTNVNQPVAAVRWWGIATVSPSGNPCDLTGTPLDITFATDNGALPGGGIVTHTVTPTIVDSGQTVAGVPLLIFEAILPEPVTIEGGTGWIDIYDPNISNNCRFGWASSVAGNGQAARFRLDLLQWEDVNDDLAVCLLPEGVIIPPEGEEGEGTPEGGTEGEGAAEGEGEPGDLSGCGEDAFVSRPPDDFEITATAFASVRSADRQVYERYDGAPGTVTGIRWWGITTTLPGGSDCTLSPPSFEVGFYEDNLSVPGGGIVEETVTPTVTNTGQTLFGVPVKLFEATFSQPIEIPASGWVSVFDTNINQTCLFSWVSSEVGGGQAVAFKFDTLSWLPLNDDVAFCLIGEAGVVEGEGEPDPEIECVEDTLFGQTPDLGPFGTGHFSARSANRKLYERFTGVDAPIVALRWWGIASQAPSGTFCNFEGTSLQISFSMEGGAFPGGGIVEYSLTPTMTDTGIEVASLPLYLFEVELPEPVTIEGGAGWVGIYDPDFQNTCRFGWASSVDGNGQSRRFRFDTLTWENVNDDLAICLVGLPAEGEGEGTKEGAIEGEGEGTAEGEGEGVAEGEGEGTTEGEGEGEVVLAEYVGTDTNWFNPSNWSTGQVPDGQTAVRIADGREVSIDPAQGSGSVAVGDVYVENGASLHLLPGSIFTFEDMLLDVGRVTTQSAGLVGNSLDISDGPVEVVPGWGFGQSTVKLNPSFGILLGTGIAEADAVFVLGLAGTEPAAQGNTGTGYYANIASDEVVLGATLQVEFLHGYVPRLGDTFDIVVASSGLTGTFANLPQGAAVASEGDVDLIVQYLADRVRLVATLGSGEGEDLPDCTFPLSGAQEVGPVATDATGLGYFTTDLFGELTGLYVEHNVANPTMAHIHAAAAGVNGGVIIDLGSPVSPIVVAFTPEQVALLRNTPAFYVNVHSSDFSSGEIRGQAEQCLPEQPEGSDARNALDDFDEADTSGDGRMDFTEFSARFGLSGDAFNALDLNGDQRLSIAELQRQLPEGKPVHNADQDGDGSVALGELLRVIQLYNAGAYDCANDPDATEDGFEIAASKGLSQDCAPHASDYKDGADGVISLSELLRLIQLFNLQSFIACAESEDGFCVAI